MTERQRIRQTWQGAKQAAVALAFVLPLTAGLASYGCSSCQNNQKGVERMGNGNTEFLKKEEDPKKKTIVAQDSVKTKADTLDVKKDSILLDRMYNSSKELEKQGIPLETEREQQRMQPRTTEVKKDSVSLEDRMFESAKKLNKKGFPFRTETEEKQIQPR